MPARYWLGAVGSFSQASATEILGRIRFPDGSNGLEETCDGANAGFSTIEIEDPGADLSIQVWRPFWVTEADCTTDTRIYTGFIWSLSYARGESLKTTSARVITVQLIDLNAVAKLRVIRGSGGKRPIETTAARLSWLLGNVLDGVAYDNSLISVPTVNRDEADFTGSYATDVLSALSQDGALDAYFIWDAAAAAGHEITLVVEPIDGAQRSSTLKISNRLSDTTATPSTYYPPSLDATLDRDGSEVYSGILLRYNGGEVYKTRAATDSTYFGVYGRDWVEDEQRIGKSATANDQATLLLEKHSIPVDTINCKVILPTDKVNLIRAGQLLPVRFQHLPGYDSLTTTKVKKRSVKELGHDTTYRYELTLELSIGHHVGGGGGGTGGTPAPPPQAATPTLVQTGTCHAATTGLGGDLDYVNASFPVAPTEGNTVVFWAAIREGTSVTIDSGWTVIDSIVPATSGGELAFRGIMGYRTVAAGDTGLYRIAANLTNVSYRVQLLEFSGISTPPVATAYSNEPPFPTANMSVANQGGVTIAGYANDWVNAWTADGAFTTDCEGLGSNGANIAPRFLLSHAFGGSSSTASMAAGGTSWGGVIASFPSGDSESVPPRSGQPVGTGENPELIGIGDGSTTSFTTRYPFLNGSLHVMIDRLDQTGSIVSFDGATGTFRFLNAPPVGARIEVWYQGR